MNSQLHKNKNIPDKPGVYFFVKGKEILYIGKATSLRDRTRSYFGKDLLVTRGPLFLDLITQIDDIKWHVTDSVIEALILEALLIQKYQPKYNTKQKDDKSFNYVCITKPEVTESGDKIPKVAIVRGKILNVHDYTKVYGPFTNGGQLKEAMRIIRRIFPYVDDHSLKKNNTKFYHQLKLTPENISHYKQNIKNLNLFFQGKKKSIIQNMKKEMMDYAKKKEFEKAGEIKSRIFALQHINDIAVIKTDFSDNLFVMPGDPLKSNMIVSPRIEAYDIAHMSGKNMVGVMVVVRDGEPVKSEYKKFIIKTQEGANDTGALLEVLTRRLKHSEWGLPNIIVVDGGQSQKNIAEQAVSQYSYDIKVLSVVKDESHKAKAIIGDQETINNFKKSILLANVESHRFAIAFHKKKRGKSFLK